MLGPRRSPTARARSTTSPTTSPSSSATAGRELLRAPQGRDARLPRRLAGDPRALPRGRPAGVHPRQHGHGSFVLAGPAGAIERSFGTACHGAGPRLSPHRRAQAHHRRRAAARSSRREGIVVRCPSNRGLAEEAPFAYKDVERVVEVVERAGLAARVARLARSASSRARPSHPSFPRTPDPWAGTMTRCPRRA